MRKQGNREIEKLKNAEIEKKLNPKKQEIDREIQKSYENNICKQKYFFYLYT